MKLAISFITHNRVEYSKKSFQSLLETSSPEDAIFIIDNASSDDTGRWISDMWEGEIGATYPQFKGSILLPENKYPGYACNKGWEQCLKVLPDADLMMRADNDLLFLPGWREEAIKAFKAMPLMGQLGYFDQLQSFRDDEEAQKLPYKMPVILHTENGYTVNRWWTNCGGPSIIRRDLYDVGLRYDEKPWHNDQPGIPKAQEDVLLSLAVQQMGYWLANTLYHGCEEMSFGNTADYFSYYEKTFSDRGHPRPARTSKGEILEPAGGIMRSHTAASDHI